MPGVEGPIKFPDQQKYCRSSWTRHWDLTRSDFGNVQLIFQCLWRGENTKETLHWLEHRFNKNQLKYFLPHQVSCSHIAYTVMLCSLYDIVFLFWGVTYWLFLWKFLTFVSPTRWMPTTSAIYRGFWTLSQQRILPKNVSLPWKQALTAVQIHQMQFTIQAGKGKDGLMGREIMFRVTWRD